MSEATKLPSQAQMLAIARESLNAKDKSTQLHAPIKERKKSFYEVGNGNPKALALLESLLKIHGNNEIRADDTAAHCQQALDIYREHTKDKGHVGNLADMAEASADGEEGEGADAGEPDLNAAPTAEGGVPLGDAQKQFEATAEVAKKRRAARKKLDLPEDGSAAVTAEAAPPPPPSDDDEADLRPAMLRRKEQEREEAAGTFAQVH